MGPLTGTADSGNGPGSGFTLSVGTGGAGGSAQVPDEINVRNVPGTVTPGNSYTVNIDYVAGVDRTMEVYFQDDNNQTLDRLGKTVPEGDRTENWTLDVPNSVNTGEVKITAVLAPLGTSNAYDDRVAVDFNSGIQVSGGASTGGNALWRANIASVGNRGFGQINRSHVQQIFGNDLGAGGLSSEGEHRLATENGRLKVRQEGGNHPDYGYTQIVPMEIPNRPRQALAFRLRFANNFKFDTRESYGSKMAIGLSRVLRGNPPGGGQPTDNDEFSMRFMMRHRGSKGGTVFCLYLYFNGRSGKYGENIYSNVVLQPGGTYLVRQEIDLGSNTVRIKVNNESTVSQTFNIPGAVSEVNSGFFSSFAGGNSAWKVPGVYWNEYEMWDIHTAATLSDLDF